MHLTESRLPVSIEPNFILGLPTETKEGFLYFTKYEVTQNDGRLTMTACGLGGKTKMCRPSLMIRIKNLLGFS